MSANETINILLVDDQPAKLLAYEVILGELGENLIKAASGREALQALLKNEIAVVLVDVCMPELDGFQLAAMIREHPRFQQTAIIFISAIHLTDMDRLRGYAMGAVDYVPVPVIPEVLRAKVKVFAELYRKTRELERLNVELERRVTERTAELESSTARLLQSERLRSLALAAGQMGAWEWDAVSGDFLWDEGQCRIFGVDPKKFAPTRENVSALIDPDDWERMLAAVQALTVHAQTHQAEFRVRRPNGEIRWCFGATAASLDSANRIVRLSGVTVDITDRKNAEERQTLLVREVDHRARNALAVVQSIVHLTKAKSIESYIEAVEGRITALSRAHVLLSESRWEGADLESLFDEELAPYRGGEPDKIVANGPSVFLEPATAQILALTLHELATNAAKYGALSSPSGGVRLNWQIAQDSLNLRWVENGGPAVQPPQAQGYGTKVITASVARQLGGRATFEWQPGGLDFSLSIPRSDKTKSLDGGSGRGRSAEDSRCAAAGKSIAGSRLLLVEDEALVGMMMKDMLTDLGFEVTGPCAGVADAIAAIAREDFHAAVLDVNLQGEMVYPVADALNAKNVPFVFVTGYGAEGIDKRFVQIPVLQKPIDTQMLQGIFVKSTNGSGQHQKERFIWNVPASAPANSSGHGATLDCSREDRLDRGTAISTLPKFYQSL